MKKLFTLLFVAAAMSSLVSCGPNKEDEAKAKAAEQAKMDSLFKFSSQSTAAAMDSVAGAMKDTTKAPAMK